MAEMFCKTFWMIWALLWYIRIRTEKRTEVERVWETPVASQGVKGWAGSWPLPEEEEDPRMLVSVQVSICPQSKWVKGAESSHSSLHSVWPLLCLVSPGTCTRLLCLMGSPALLWGEVPDTDLQQSPPAQPR